MLGRSRLVPLPVLHPSLLNGATWICGSQMASTSQRSPMLGLQAGGWGKNKIQHVPVLPIPPPFWAQSAPVYALLAPLHPFLTCTCLDRAKPGSAILMVLQVPSWVTTSLTLLLQKKKTTPPNPMFFTVFNIISQSSPCFVLWPS